MPNTIIEYTPATPPDLTIGSNGAITTGNDYIFSAPSLASEPLVITAPDGSYFSWKLTELVYKDSNGVMDYIVGSSPESIVVTGKQARYNRTFPIANDIFRAEAGRVKHWTVLDEAPRLPAEYLSGNILFGVSGLISGISLPTGIHESINVDRFNLPQPIIKDLAENEITGFYEVVDAQDGQQLFIWFEASYLTNAVYPVMIDPTVIVNSYPSTNGFKRLVMLSNNWLVASAGSTTVTFYVSKDLGATWSQLCFATGVVDASTIVSNGTIVYFLTAIGSTSVRAIKFDAVTVLNQELNTAGNYTDIDTGQTAIGTLAMAYDPTNAKVWSVWASKNSTYPNAYNIRVSSSGDGITWDSPSQLTTQNTSGLDQGSPQISIRSGQPVIIYTNIQPLNRYIGCLTFNGSVWTNNSTAADITDTNGSSVLGILIKKNGSNINRIYTFVNLNLSSYSNGFLYYSDDGGVTFVSGVQIYNNTWVLSNPSLAEDHTGAIYIVGNPNGGAVGGYKVADGASSATNLTFGFTGSSKPQIMALEQANIVGYMSTANASPYYLTFDKFLFNTIPNPPTNLSNYNFDATLDSPPFTWTFNDPDSLSYQTAYQIQITKVSDNSLVLDTGKVTSGISSYTLPANTLANGNQYQWKVNTWDNWGAMGTYSSLVSFYAVTPPTVAFLFPSSDSYVHGQSSITAQWSYTDTGGFSQQSYQLKLTDNSDNVLWDSGVLTSNSQMMTVGYILANLTSYKLKVVVTDSQGVSSSQVTRLFSTNLNYPDQPTITLSSGTGCIQIIITNPGPTGGKPSVGCNDLYRRNTGTSLWTRIASNVFSYSDYAVSSGQSYDYKVTALGTNGVNIDSDISIFSISLLGVWLHDVTNPIGTIYQFLGDGNGRDETWQAESTLMQFAGRKRPIVEFSEMDEDKISAQLELNSTDYSNLQSLVKSKSTLCFRDSRGRKMFGTITALPIVDAEKNCYTTTIEINETSYSEVV